MKTARRWWFVLWGLWLVLVVAMTITPIGGANTNHWNCVFCGEQAVADGILNLFMFIPAGLSLAMAGVRTSRAIFASMATTFLIELVQVAVPGRDASIGDLISNSAGAIVGVVLARYWGSLVAPSTGLARSLVAAWCVLVSLLAIVSALLLQPRFTPGLYFGHWTPRFSDLEWYRGRVLDARVAQGRMPIGAFRLSDSLVRSLEAGEPVVIDFIVGQNTERLSPIFAISDQDQYRILLIGADGPDLVVQYRMRASAFRLIQPDIRLADAFLDTQRGDSVRVEFSRDGSKHCVKFREWMTCELGFNVAQAWSLLLYPVRVMPEWSWILDLLWFMALFAPVGFWGRLAPRTLWVGLPVGVILIMPRFVDIRPVPASDWIGLIAGVALGVIAGSVATRHMRQSNLAEQRDQGRSTLQRP